MIRVPEVRVIDSEGEQLGIMATDAALARAEEDGLDLVEVSPTARPPVCRIMDFGKYKYEQSKKQKESKKASSRGRRGTGWTSAGSARLKVRESCPSCT